MGRPKMVDTLTVRKFVNKHRPVLYGMMLGDSSIINRGSHAMFRVYHAEDQKDLVFHKYELLKEVAPTPPKVYDCKYGQPKWYFYTASDVEWQRLWSIFHQDAPPRVVNGKKIFYKKVTSEILRGLDDRGLAMWIMDDGSYTYGHQKTNPSIPMHFFRLSTEGYSLPENELIASWFKEKYGVTSSIYASHKKLKDGTSREYFYIRIGWREFEKIVPRVKPHIISSMTYKIGMGSSQDNGQLDVVELKTRSGLHGNVETRTETDERPPMEGQ
jgi:hypothetical protein